MNTQRTYSSPNYGGKLGYAIFHWMIRLFGVIPAYVLLAFIVPYYVLVRRSARKSAAPYLKRRFPRQGAIARFFTTAYYFYRFGQVLIDQGAVGILGKDYVQPEFPDSELLYRLANDKKGLVLITTHVGNWQSAMSTMEHLGVPVHFLFRLEAHTRGRHFFDISGERGRFHIISPDTPFGGMIEMTKAIQNGECVATMGDRAWGARTREATFLGDAAQFPITPYILVKATGAHLVLFLTVRTGRLKFRIECTSIAEDIDCSRMTKEETIEVLLKRYVATLENYLDRHPYMWFNFYDFWSKDKNTKEFSS